MADDDEDIRADEAWERQHRRSKGLFGLGKRRKETPIWGWSAGTWAQLLLAAILWGLFAAAIHSSAGPSNSEAKGLASVCAIFPALVLAFVLWRALGQGGRDAARWGVRLLPLVLGGLCVINGAIQQRAERRQREAHPSPPATPATPVLPGSRDPEPPPPPRTGPPPARPAETDELVLLERAKQLALRALEQAGELSPDHHGRVRFERVRVGGRKMWRVAAQGKSGEWVIDVDDAEPAGVRSYPRAEAPAAER